MTPFLWSPRHFGLSRRSLIKAADGAATVALGLGTTQRLAHADSQTIRIGFQKYGTLVPLKGRGELEGALEPHGFKVEWTEFPAGPQLLERLNVSRGSDRSATVSGVPLTSK